MKRKNLRWDHQFGTAEQSEITDFVVVDDEVYPADQPPPGLEAHQTEDIDEDYLYEAFRDSKVEQLENRS